MNLFLFIIYTAVAIGFGYLIGRFHRLPRATRVENFVDYDEAMTPAGRNLEDPEYRYFTLTEKDRAEMPLAVTMFDVLIQQGFDPLKEITWWDDPISGNRTYKQKKVSDL